MSNDISQYLTPEGFADSFMNRKRARFEDIDVNNVFGLFETEEKFCSYTKDKRLDGIVYSSIVALESDLIKKTSSGLFILEGVRGPYYNFNIGVKLGNVLFFDEVYELPELKDVGFFDVMWQTKKYWDVRVNKVREVITELNTNPLAEELRNYVTYSYSVGLNMIKRTYKNTDEAEFLMKVK